MLLRTRLAPRSTAPIGLPGLQVFHCGCAIYVCSLCGGWTRDSQAVGTGNRTGGRHLSGSSHALRVIHSILTKYQSTGTIHGQAKGLPTKYWGSLDDINAGTCNLGRTFRDLRATNWALPFRGAERLPVRAARVDRAPGAAHWLCSPQESSHFVVPRAGRATQVRLKLPRPVNQQKKQTPYSQINSAARGSNLRQRRS